MWAKCEKKKIDFLGQITGAIWYLLAIERNDTCWRDACTRSGKCIIDYLYCGNKHMKGYGDWAKISNQVLTSRCSVEGVSTPFKYGIYTQAVSSRIIESRIFFSKFCYCLWWGMQNLRYFNFFSFSFQISNFFFSSI